MQAAKLVVAYTWDGEPLPPEERASLRLRFAGAWLEVEVDAPFHADPAPAAPPGSTDRLWEHEVVELFLLGAGQRYLELELGPHGHYLVLQLRGPRGLETKGLPLDYTVERRGARWRGRAQLPRELLPEGLHAGNAYAIHGTGAQRRYAAAHPVPGPAPDFHRLDCFGPLGL